MKSIRMISLIILITFMGIVWSGPVRTVEIKEETKEFLLSIKYPQGFSDKHIDSLVKNFITTIRKAGSNLKSSKDLPEMAPGKNSLYIDYKIMFQGNQALSILFNVSSYTRGAAHPNNSVSVLNFIDSRNVNLTQVFNPHSNYLTQIANYCRPLIMKIDGADEKWVTTGTAPTADNYRNWYFSKEGLVVVFDTYQVASYVFGPQSITVPTSELKKFLRPGVEKAVWGNA